MLLPDDLVLEQHEVGVGEAARDRCQVGLVRGGEDELLPVLRQPGDLVLRVGDVGDGLDVGERSLGRRPVKAFLDEPLDEAGIVVGVGDTWRRAVAEQQGRRDRGDQRGAARQHEPRAPTSLLLQPALGLVSFQAFPHVPDRLLLGGLEEARLPPGQLQRAVPAPAAQLGEPPFAQQVRRVAIGALPLVDRELE